MNYLVNLISIVLFLSSLDSVANDFGTFVLVKGKVFIEASDSSRSAAKINSKIFEGQTIISEADSRAKIVMSDRNIINVLPNTKIKIEKYRTSSRDKNVSLNLIEGKIRTNVEQTYDNKTNKFEVRTSTAVAGVRGTQFITSYDKVTELTEIVTIDGRVSLTAFTKMGMSKELPTEIFVNQGERIQIKNNGEASDPIRIPNQEFKSIDSDSNISDEEKRNKLEQSKLEDSENIVGGVNSNPLNPKNNLFPMPQTQIQRDNQGKSRTIIEIGN